jgi:hypothetical protein
LELISQDEPPEQPIVRITRYSGSHSTKQKEGFNPAKRVSLGGFSAIPYGALVPEEFDNVLAAGRCISVDECLMDTIRMMTTCMVMGQTAAIAADLAIDQSISNLADVPYADLREGLLAQGCLL